MVRARNSTRSLARPGKVSTPNKSSTKGGRLSKGSTKQRSTNHYFIFLLLYIFYYVFQYPSVCSNRQVDRDFATEVRSRLRGARPSRGAEGQGTFDFPSFLKKANSASSILLCFFFF